MTQYSEDRHHFSKTCSSKDVANHTKEQWHKITNDFWKHWLLLLEGNSLLWSTLFKKYQFFLLSVDTCDRRISRSQLLYCANPLGDTRLQSPWNQARNEMIENSNQALGETRIFWLFGITDSKWQVELFFYCIYSQIHTTLLSLLQKYISSVLRRMTLPVMAETTGHCGWSWRYQHSKNGVDGVVNMDNLLSRSCLRNLSFLEFLLSSQFKWWWYVHRHYWATAISPCFPCWCFPHWYFPWWEQLCLQRQGNCQFLYNPKLPCVHRGSEHLVPISR